MKDGKQTSELWVSVGSILFIMLASTILLWFGKITNDQWITLAKWIPIALGGIYEVIRGSIKITDIIKNPGPKVQ
jgi:hypothetical protein